MDGEKLKRILAAEGISATDLARLLGCTRQNVSALFKSPSVKLEKIEEIASLIGKKVTDFIAPDYSKNTIAELRAQLEEKDAEIKRLNARIDKLLEIMQKG